MFDVNVYQENMFHTKMHVKDFDLDTYLFEANADDLSFKDRQRIDSLLQPRDRGTVPRTQFDLKREWGVGIGGGKSRFILPMTVFDRLA